MDEARDRADRKPPWTIGRWIVIVAVAALIPRLILVGTEVSTLSAADIRMKLHFDSRDYLHLAHNLVATGSYLGASHEPSDAAARASQHERLIMSHHYGLLRTPGYPVFCAIFDRLGCTPAGILWTQAFLGAGIPVLALLLANELLGRRTWAVVAGVAAALSPTGIGLCGMVLVDLLFALVLLAGVTLLCFGVRWASWPLCVGAGAAFAAGLLLKPTLLFVPVLIVPLAWLLAAGAGRRPRWRQIAVVIMLPMLAWGGWSARNAMVEGRFMYSSITGQNLRHFLALAVELHSPEGREVWGEDVFNAQDKLRRRDWDDLRLERMTPGQIAARQEHDGAAIVRQHPWVAVWEYAKFAMQNADCDWALYRMQLPDGSVAQRAFWGLNGFTRLTHVVGVALGLWAIGAAWWQRRRPEQARRLPGYLALLAVVLYIAAFSGTTFAVGFRIVYPAQFAYIILAVAGMEQLGNMGQHMDRCNPVRDLDCKHFQTS